MQLCRSIYCMVEGVTSRYLTKLHLNVPPADVFSIAASVCKSSFSDRSDCPLVHS